MEHSNWRQPAGSGIAGAHPLDGRAARATGNHLVAQNDEPEPFSEDELLAGDLERNHDKARRRARLEHKRALHAQVNDPLTR